MEYPFAAQVLLITTKHTALQKICRIPLLNTQIEYVMEAANFFQAGVL